MYKINRLIKFDMLIHIQFTTFDGAALTDRVCLYLLVLNLYQHIRYSLRNRCSVVNIICKCEYSRLGDSVDSTLLQSHVSLKKSVNLTYD